MDGYNYTIQQDKTGFWYDDRNRLIDVTRCPVMDVSDSFIGDIVSFVGLINNQTIHLSIEDYNTLPNQSLELVQFVNNLLRSQDGN